MVTNANEQHSKLNPALIILGQVYPSLIPTTWNYVVQLTLLLDNYMGQLSLLQICAGLGSFFNMDPLRQVLSVLGIRFKKLPTS